VHMQIAGGNLHIDFLETSLVVLCEPQGELVIFFNPYESHRWALSDWRRW
jgi:hypothetical protein